MKQFKKFALLGLALFVGLCMTPNKADAAVATFDTSLGEMTVEEAGYDYYFAYGNAEDTVVVFYNGDFSYTNTFDAEGNIIIAGSATGTSKLYAPGNNYIPEELSAGAQTPAYFGDFMTANSVAVIIGGNKEATAVTVLPDSSSFSIPHPVIEIVTKKGMQEFTVSVLEDLGLADGTYDYHTVAYSAQNFVRIEKDDSTVSYYEYPSGLVTDSDTLTNFEGSWTSITEDDEMGVTLLFGNADVTGTDFTSTPRYGEVNTNVFPVFAGMTAVDVDIEPTTVNVVVPLNVNVAIDVNQENGVIHGDIVIQNNTKAPVKIGISKFASTNLPFTSLILPTDLPAELDWDLLSAENSAKYFSFGLTTNDDGTDAWKSPAANTVWAIPNFKPKAFAVINSEASSNLTVEAFFGRTQAKTNAFTFSVTFVAELE